ncbi:stalk domain-containing protein [Natranaerofaba carboxydovora]|uniref:stalk domain-containing protein n=1 Tax=Natranaerofaba carboxydovora TaxID=2742683 RepID=UPI001F146CC3|nr:CAP-associated domain-containing protein [Natranaerofaba carboxydovora]UMZ73669.1 hypothetical protein ACONDI_01232 [Natranaerofaba carboxydovora]
MSISQKTLYRGYFVLVISLTIFLLMMFNIELVHSKQEIEVMINDKPAVFTDATPYIDSNNRTMVPIRFISENLGAEVEWDPQTETVTVSKDELHIELQIDSDIISVNGIEEEMDTKMVFNEEYNRNYVPLRFVSENLGSSVDWNRDNSVITISITDKVDDNNDKGKEFYGLSIGDSKDSVIELLDKPDRKDPSAYGFEWWIYNHDYENYLQVGINGNNKVVNLYSNSNNLNFKGLKVGLSEKEAKKLFPYEETVEYSNESADYTINQSDKSPMEKYLVITEDDIALEIFIDIHNNNYITSVRLSEPEFVLASGNYSISWTFSGDSPEHQAQDLSEQEQEEVNRANELQLFDLVNSIRVRMGIDPLDFHEEIAVVAKEHSIDMYENNFFSHTSPTTGGPGDRVTKANILYSSVGENIAFGQSDAIEAHENLMNSLGHREAILNPVFQALGTGAYNKYYTQKFITPR